MRRLDLLMLVAVATLPLAAVAQVADAADNLADLQAEYQAECQKIEARYEELATAALGEYSQALTVLGQACAKKGDLDDVVAVRSESTRFEKERRIPEEALVESPVELRKLQEKFREQPAAIEAEKARAIAKAAAAHVVRLEKLKKSLTQNMKVEDALLVKAEIEKVKKTVALPLGQPDNTPRRRKPIPGGAAEYGGHHYLVVDGKMTWRQAAQVCEAMGGHLVVIADQDESGFVNGLVQGRHLWIGLHDGGKVGQWRWVDGTRPTFQNWFDTKPDNLPGGENFAHLKTGNGATRWDDETAKVTMGCVCEWDY